MIYLVVGVPASGKSWVCEQLKNKIEYVHHDLYVGMSGEVYVNAIKEVHKKYDVLAESPFGVTKIMEQLKPHAVEPVFIIEPPEVLEARYLAREGKELPVGRVKLQGTYRQRSVELDAFCGTSTEVLEYLKRRICK